jgi:CheY-like chemotaxis protein
MATRALRPPSVLVVNDAPDERDMYARTLRAYGYRVVHAATSVAAYQIAITGGTDVVVTNVHIAGSMSGLELTRRLRIHTRTTAVPIIVLTSVSRPQDGNVALKAGANMFLEIPVPAVVLRDQVARLLDESATPSQYTSTQDCSSLAQRTAVAQRASRDGVMVSPGSSHNARKPLAYGECHGTVDRNCPQCLELLEYRDRWPILSTRVPTATSRGSRERLRYESGWFCTNPACEFCELKARNE